MTKKITFLVAAITLALPKVNKAHDAVIPNKYQTEFNAAYAAYPSVPKGILEAVSFSQTRFQNLDNSLSSSCIGMPKASTVFGLFKDGKNYFRENFTTVVSKGEVSELDLLTNVSKSTLAYAKTYSILQTELKTGSDIETQKEVLVALSEIPLDNNAGNIYAMESYLYQIYWFLNNAEFQQAYSFPSYTINLKEIFKTNYDVLSASKIHLNAAQISSTSNARYNANNSSIKTLSTDYGPAIWNAAASCNYSSRGGTAISAITIHDVEGSYSSCISWFQNCAASVSAHYVIRSSDGQVTQMVDEYDKAWHVGNENPYAIGIEHEGYNTNPAWYTNAMYTKSALLCKDICNSGYNINPVRTHYGASCNGVCLLGNCTRIKGHQHFPNNNHNDPGQYWDWYKFYNLINDNVTPTVYNNATGTIYDAGGANGNYTDDEHNLQLIQPTGAANIALTFTQFDLETDWDYLLVYDGSTTNSALIGEYTSNTIPATINSTGGALLLDFRSDCATGMAGYAANYTSTLITGIAKNNAQLFNITIHNNPVADVLNIVSANTIIEKYQVIDYTGKIIINENTVTKDLKVDVTYLSQGVYVFKALDKNNQQATLRFIKN
jgi:N-acetyl-anhydromuramyl-L-alanine amidase AmpD